MDFYVTMFYGDRELYHIVASDHIPLINPALANTGYIWCYISCLCDQHRIYPVFGYPCTSQNKKLHRSIKGYCIILDIKVLPFTMFLFLFVRHIIEKELEIYEILLIWWVDPQYPWSNGIGSPIRGSSMTRVNVRFF